MQGKQNIIEGSGNIIKGSGNKVTELSPKELEDMLKGY